MCTSFFIVPLGTLNSSTISATMDVSTTEQSNSNGKTEVLDIALPIFAGILVVVVAVGCYLRFR